MRKLIAVIFILVLVIPLLTASLVTTAVRSWIFNRDFYNQLFNSERVEFVMENPDILTPLIEQSGGNEEFAIAANAAFRTVITPEYLESQLVSFVDQLFAFFQSSSPTLNLQLDLKPIKDAIDGEKKAEFLDAFVLNLPSCTTGKYAKFPQADLEYCLSMGSSPEIRKQEVADQMLPKLFTYMPDSIQVSSVDLSAVFKWLSLFGIVSIAQAFNIGLLILLVVAVICWLISAFIADKRGRVKLRWLGGALIIPAILTIALGFFIQSSQPLTRLNDAIQSTQATLFGTDLLNSIMDAAQVAISRIGLAFLIVGVVAIGIASILLALGILIRPKS